MEGRNRGYDPSEIEDKWYEFWEKKGLFVADNDSDSEPYSIVIPPPNVTGSLHMGHALNNTLQDILIRFKGMQGRNTLWMPGTDHAGIATQNVVEKDLAKIGKTRHDLGREMFVDRVWEWKEEHGGLIIKQLKKLGASCDWTRERFTMDEGLSKAVRLVFVTLYNDGLIYRGDYISNWCPRCHTALADLEVEHEETKGHLYYIRYPYLDDDGKYVAVATTRPETMFGDTAVAVNPDDERYKELKGKKLVLPIINRELPVIFDEYVSLEFGTGALKITPAHDANDFEIGNKHNLERVVVINVDATLNEGAGPYNGMDRYEAREKVVSDLKEMGLLEKVEEYPVPLGKCYRCHTVVEPLVSKQWFVKADVLAREAIAAVRDGRTKIVPKQWENTYFDWMENIRDWCVSRQLWWGHRIPAWYCEDCGEVIVSMEDPKECGACKGKKLTQDTDVLDTWFSSALWPFSTLGWPDKTKDLEVYYPTSALITGFDIIFFWVARMMMMGLYFMKDVPFKDVYIHALVRDEMGHKMSKSKGNVIDPLTIIERYGADAFRFTLTAFAAMGRDIKLSESRIEGYRFFINKLWNAARFVLMNIGEGYATDFANFDFTKEDLTLADRWLLSRLQSVTGEVTAALESYEFNVAATSLYQFVWHELCDWYIEMSKIYLYSDNESESERTKNVLLYALTRTLKLLHPIIPFVTEEIYSNIKESLKGSVVDVPDFLMKSPFPEVEDALSFPDAESSFAYIRDIVTNIRNIRGEMNIHPKKRLTVMISSADGKEIDLIKEYGVYIESLAGVEKIETGRNIEQPEGSATSITGPYTIYVPLVGIVDFTEEKKRLDKEMEKLKADLVKVEGKLGSENFISKAPEEVVAKERNKRHTILAKRDNLLESLKKVEEYLGSSS